MDHASQLLSRLLRFSAATRLYRLEIAGQPEDRFLVEAWAAVESLHAVGATELIVLSLDTEVAARSLLGSLATLNSRLAEGGMCRSTGLIHEVAKLGGDGGFGRYRLRMAPWPWLLSQASTSRVWQDKTLIEVVEDVFREFPQHADWHWSADALTYLARVPPRSYTVQYRQTHLDFISRLLAGEGLSWRIEEHAPGPQGHRLVIFADSTARSAFPEDPTSAAHDGIRFQGARELDQQDGIQALAACRSLQAASCTLLSYDYRNKQAITASIPTHHDFGGRDAPRLESYDSAGPVTDDKDAADRHARLMMEAAEARNKRWLGRSTVRSLRAGARFSLKQGPLAGKEQEYAVLAVLSVGFNNLPADTQAALRLHTILVPRYFRWAIIQKTFPAPDCWRIRKDFSPDNPRRTTSLRASPTGSPSLLVLTTWIRKMMRYSSTSTVWIFSGPPNKMKSSGRRSAARTGPAISGRGARSRPERRWATRHRNGHNDVSSP